MADHGDRPSEDDEDHAVGFFSPQALTGRVRARPEPEPDPIPAPEHEIATPGRSSEDDRTDAASTDPFDAPPVETIMEPRRPDPLPYPTRDAAPAERTGFGRATGGRRPAAAPAVENANSLFTVYALILFAVPTLGVSALIGLLAVWGEPAGGDARALSHRRFQKRTLLIAAVAAVAGAVLIAAPFGIGVLVLFALALWLIARGAWGVLTLKAGRTVANPDAWMIPESR